MSLINLVNFLINNPCEDPEILKVIFFIKKLFEIAFVVVPIVLIVLITFDFVKNVTAGSEDTMKKTQKIVIKRLVYAVLLFFVVPIVNVVFGAFDGSGNGKLLYNQFEDTKVNYLSCWTNAKNMKKINDFEKVAKFDGNGGTVYGGLTKTCGGSVFCELKGLPRASKKNYVFIGWSSTKDCDNVVNSITLYEKETKFYACYKEKEKEEIVILPNQNGTGTSSNATGFWWPIAEKDKKLAYKRRGYKSSHLGLDITSSSGKVGVIDVIAAYDGVVDTVWNDVPSKYDGMYGKSGATSSKLHDGYGNGVIIKHNYNGKVIYSYYTHMTQAITVKKGDWVTAGTVLGKMGNSANSSGTHLHFEIRAGSKSRDYKSENNPENYVKEGKYPSSGATTNNQSTTNNNTSSNSNATSGSVNTKKCNGRDVNITKKDGVTYINGTIVVNKTYSLPSNYNPEGLTNKSQMSSTALSAFKTMASAIKKEKGVEIKIYSGFRSYSTQQATYNKWVSQKGKVEADRISARPGHSEHQTGLAVDINNVKSSFKNTIQGKWLKDNAYKYGFILRYLEGKESVTGYDYEPWHYRYVGKDLAKELYNNGNWITMEEYFCIDSKYK